MSKIMKTYLLAFLFALAFGQAASAAETKFTNVRVTGTLAVVGAVTAGSVNCSNVTTTTLTTDRLVAVYGVTAATGTFTNATNAVTVSSATASTSKMYLGGAFAALPTSGFSSGALVVLTTDKKLYISTEAVTATTSWLAVGSQ